MTSIHLASACGYVRSLAWVRIWDKFRQVSVRRSAVHICYRLRLVFFARFCLTLRVSIYSQERDQRSTFLTTERLSRYELNNFRGGYW